MSSTQFGRARPAGRLLAARSLVYLQAGILVLGAGWMFVILITAGSATSTAFPMQGLVDQANVSGAGVAVLAVVNVCLAAAAVFLDREAERNPQGYRATFAALEIGISLYLIGFIGTAVGDVLFGPVLALVLIGTHWWPELDARVLGGGSGWGTAPLPLSGAGLDEAAPLAAAGPAAAATPASPERASPAAPAETPSAEPLPAAGTWTALPARDPSNGGDLRPAI